MRPYTGWQSAQVWPAETSIRSAPASAKARPISTASSGVTPRSPIQSFAEIRTDIGFPPPPAPPRAGDNRDPPRHGLPARPGRAHRGEQLGGEAKPFFQAAAIFVAAPVGQRGDE